VSVEIAKAVGPSLRPTKGNSLGGLSPYACSRPPCAVPCPNEARRSTYATTPASVYRSMYVRIACSAWASWGTAMKLIPPKLRLPAARPT
jgi:hypothetical protein